MTTPRSRKDYTRYRVQTASIALEAVLALDADLLIPDDVRILSEAVKTLANLAADLRL